MQINEHVGQVQSRVPSRAKRRSPGDSSKTMDARTEQRPELAGAQPGSTPADVAMTRELPRYGAGF